MENISKYFFSLFLILLTLSGVSLIGNHSGFALRLTSLIFWMLVVSIVLYIWEAKAGK